VRSLQRKWGTTKHDSATTFTHLPLELEDGKDSSKEMQCNKHNDSANLVGKYRDVGALECEFRCLSNMCCTEGLELLYMAKHIVGCFQWTFFNGLILMRK